MHIEQPRTVTVIGAGLAGCEVALQLSLRGHRVRLLEQKPQVKNPVQCSDGFAELVCSNSLRAASTGNAVGLLKEEMRRLGSFVMRAADETQVPAGGALAVDRERFSGLLTRWVSEHPLIEVVPGVVCSLPEERPLVVATGPLTGDALASALEERLGSRSIAYYDAISPIVTAASVDFEQVFFASRWGKGEDDASRCAYANCPFDREQYGSFVEALRTATVVGPNASEQPRYFEGCLPIEVLAARGPDTLAFGPMKPVGLVDPKTGRRPHAVVQLRPENTACTAYSLVGFQTRMTRSEQARVLRMIPGLQEAEFERWGSVHRNTFIDAPRVLDGCLRLRTDLDVWFAGQVAGVEGYVESAACGLVCALLLKDVLDGRQPNLPPLTTALGALLGHTLRVSDSYQPSNVTFSMFEPLETTQRKQDKRARGQAYARRGLDHLSSWWALHPSAPKQCLVGSVSK